jgi:hypothetical protein
MRAPEQNGKAGPAGFSAASFILHMRAQGDVARTVLFVGQQIFASAGLEGNIDISFICKHL